VTPADQSTNDRLTRIEVKLDLALTNHQDHEARLRSLEKARWPLPSLAVLIALGSLITALSGLLAKGG
jgi:hypothetical protein